MGTGSRVKSFPRAFPSSNDVPILLLNQPNMFPLFQIITSLGCQGGLDVNVVRVNKVQTRLTLNVRLYNTLNDYGVRTITGPQFSNTDLLVSRTRMKPLNEVQTDHTNHSVISKKQTNKKSFSTQAIKNKDSNKNLSL